MKDSSEQSQKNYEPLVTCPIGKIIDTKKGFEQKTEISDKGQRVISKSIRQAKTFHDVNALKTKNDKTIPELMTTRCNTKNFSENVLMGKVSLKNISEKKSQENVGKKSILRSFIQQRRDIPQKSPVRNSQFTQKRESTTRYKFQKNAEKKITEKCVNTKKQTMSSEINSPPNCVGITEGNTDGENLLCPSNVTDEQKLSQCTSLIIDNSFEEPTYLLNKSHVNQPSQFSKKVVHSQQTNTLNALKNKMLESSAIAQTSKNNLSLQSILSTQLTNSLDMKPPFKSKSLPILLKAPPSKNKKLRKDIRQKNKNIHVKTYPESSTYHEDYFQIVRHEIADAKVLPNNSIVNKSVNAFYKSNHVHLNLMDTSVNTSHKNQNENAFSRLGRPQFKPTLPKIGKMYTKLQKDAIKFIKAENTDVEDYERPFVLGDRIQNFIKKHSKEKFERSWHHAIPVRKNQDLQRECEEKIMKILEEKTAELCGFQKFVEKKFPTGGIYITLEDEWKIENKIVSASKEKNLSGSSSSFREVLKLKIPKKRKHE